MGQALFPVLRNRYYIVWRIDDIIILVSTLGATVESAWDLCNDTMTQRRWRWRWWNNDNVCEWVRAPWPDKFSYHSAAALFNDIAWIQHGNTNATLRMRLGFFSFVLHLLFSLRLSVLSLAFCVVDQLLAPLSRESQTIAIGNERRRWWRRWCLSTLWERLKKKSTGMDITFLTKIIPARRPLWCRRS